MTNTTQPLSLEEISKLGEKFYVEELKGHLEQKNMGEYAVIDVEQKQYRTDPDRLAAVEKARADFGDKLFYIVQVGGVQSPSMNFNAQQYAWHFS
jgi:hypothetical protein